MSDKEYKIPIQIRWADIDANNHLRHSVYYDYGALVRIQFMSEMGLTMKRLEEIRFGPVIFREEAQFKKEIHFHDKITINLKALNARKDFARWTLQHEILKEDGTLATIITLNGSWIDLDKRKLALPIPEIANVFDAMPKAENFEWTA
jgi:acyl-CoA thioester hydrolase